MYSIDERDQVVELHNLPQSDPGATDPIVVADEHRVLLAYRLPEPGDRDFEEPERWAVIEIKGCWAHFFGPPNDEALHGHPLYDRGLTPYGIFEVRNSSWIRLMETRNRVHDSHDPSRFAQLVHFIFTFHDSTFECVGESLVSTVEDGDKNFTTNLVRRLRA